MGTKTFCQLLMAVVLFQILNFFFFIKTFSISPKLLASLASKFSTQLPSKLSHLTSNLSGSKSSHLSHHFSSKVPSLSTNCVSKLPTKLPCKLGSSLLNHSTQVFACLFPNLPSQLSSPVTTTSQPPSFFSSSEHLGLHRKLRI